MLPSMLAPRMHSPRLAVATTFASLSHALPNGVTNLLSKWEPLNISSGTKVAYNGFLAWCSSGMKGSDTSTRVMTESIISVMTCLMPSFMRFPDSMLLFFGGCKVSHNFQTHKKPES